MGVLDSNPSVPYSGTAQQRYKQSFLGANSHRLRAIWKLPPPPRSCIHASSTGKVVPCSHTQFFLLRLITTHSTFFLASWLPISLTWPSTFVLHRMNWFRNWRLVRTIPLR